MRQANIAAHFATGFCAAAAEIGTFPHLFVADILAGGSAGIADFSAKRAAQHMHLGTAQHEVG